MDENKPNSLSDLLLQGRKALESGDKVHARDFANQAVLMDPNSEEPWLLLAAASSPQESVNYLKKALSINPKSLRAKKGMQWALQRVHEEEIKTESVGKRVNKINPTEKQKNLDKTAKIRKKTIPAKTKIRTQQKERNDLRWMLPLFIAILLIGLAIFCWFETPVITIILPKASVPQQATQAQPVTIPTIENTPIISIAPAESAAFISRQASLPIKLPTQTPIPTLVPSSNKTYASYFAHSWDILDPVGENGGFWLEVNLSNQMVYAYQGSNLIQSFLVSTGTSDFPTVTGTYKIYAKYPTYTMVGPGYDLADVPYSMFFYKGYSLHGTYWHHNFGTEMSHGCVNMVTSDAAWVYQRASIGTEVIIHY